jgi:hypothetical protein
VAAQYKLRGRVTGTVKGESSPYSSSAGGCDPSLVFAGLPYEGALLRLAEGV